MTTVSGQTAKNAKALSVENNKRGATIVRVCGEEHFAISEGGTATTYLAHDNDMCFISDYKFKLVFGNGNSSSSDSNVPVSRDVIKGYGTWSSMAAFQSTYPLGSAIDVDGAYGAQCWDYASAFWWGQVNRGFATGGDNARGTWTRAREVNAGTEFDLIASWAALQPGDWIVWGNGQYGHVAMAVGYPSGNTIRVWNQNGASGDAWPTGGKVVALDTCYQAGFLGAFRYRPWHSNSHLV